MRKKNKLRIILMWMLSLTLILSVNFSVFASNQNITQVFKFIIYAQDNMEVH